MSTQSSKSGSYVSYLVRRETHSSRALISVILALLLMAGLGYLATEGVLAALDRPPLLETPKTCGSKPLPLCRESLAPSNHRGSDSGNFWVAAASQSHIAGDFK